jgi:hypothetical protein
MKIKEKHKVLSMRKQGISLREIGKSVPVSRSTISRWCKDVELSEEQTIVLASRSAISGNQIKGARKRKQEARKQRLKWQLHGEELSRNDSRIIAPAMLFWAEGNKDRNSVRFSNSDPEMMRYWVDFLKEHVPMDKISITIQCHLENGRSISDIEHFWTETLQLPSTCLAKSSIVKNHPRSKNYRRNKLMNGVCRLTVCSTEFAQTLYGAIRQIAGFEKRLCLD